MGEKWPIYKSKLSESTRTQFQPKEYDAAKLPSNDKIAWRGRTSGPEGVALSKMGGTHGTNNNQAMNIATSKTLVKKENHQPRPHFSAKELAMSRKRNYRQSAQ
jgi:hypothetical protein